ncbi:C-type lectin domain family 4 member F [Danio aesculapii]|uniref:C-type lectin domain family 4 member F n=1 Tax=Danio aesculapii TaxID=1142201 RepID=UPI0024C022EF|nr:C-type lectin domain family 4 member F [Danio aesculapii]
MGSIYENSTFIPSTVASNENISQHKGNSSNEQESEREVNTAKRSKVLLIVFSVSLVFAVGGLCVLGTLYTWASMQLSAQETTSMSMKRQIEKLTANYSKVKDDLHIKDLMVKELAANNSRVKDDLRNKNTMVKELTANYSRVKEQLSFYEAFRASNGDVNITVYQGKRYFFSSDKLNWSSSRAFCASRGANLVTITSQSEQARHFEAVGCSLNLRTLYV